MSTLILAVLLVLLTFNLAYHVVNYFLKLLHLPLTHDLCAFLPLIVVLILYSINFNFLLLFLARLLVSLKQFILH